jgi:SAM-dependent methyltransferase
LSNLSIIADIGSGTGLLSEVFLKNGNIVYGVEPNLEMRSAAEKTLIRYPKFNSIEGRAEATGLQKHSLDTITVGQAFHWFDTEAAKTEFIRILKPGGWVAIIYNMLKVNTPLLEAFSRFNQKFLDDKRPDHVWPDVHSSFFGKGGFTEVILEGNSQRFDFNGLLGRVSSRANSPQEGDSGFREMVDALLAIFKDHQQDGKVKLDYNTQVIYGKI